MIIVLKRVPAAAWIAAGWVVMLACVILTRPVMPVDETRYMTVAWEMWMRHSWLVPTLNFEVYPHKPPLLFWMINAVWSLSAVGITPVRIMIFAMTFGLVLLTGRLARQLNSRDVENRSMLLLTALPMFLIYASMVMFDSLLALFSTLGMLALWQAAKTQNMKAWCAFGVALGLAMLTKGPVALVYMLPAALLAPLWMPNFKGRWYIGCGVSVLIGAAIILAWAIPAAITGGPAYAEMIFLTQSAGRMVNAFDHEGRPFWFYLPMLAAFIAPLLLWPAFWSAMRPIKTAWHDNPSIRFLVCWILPPLIFFSLISSKQAHYLVPLMPGFAIMTAIMLRDRSRGIIIPIVASGLLSVLMLGEWSLEQAGVIDAMVLTGPLIYFYPWIAALHITLVVGLALWGRNLYGMMVAAIMLVGVVHVQAGHSMLERYDLSGITPVIAAYPDAPLAAVPRYNGEYGFVAGIDRPITPLETKAVAKWLKQNPDGLVIWRTRDEADFVPYSVLYRQDYRADRMIAVIGQ